LVQKSVLLKVSETPSLKLAPGASVLPDVDVFVLPDVPPHAARIIEATTTSAPSACRRLANFDFMVFSSRVLFPAEWSSQLEMHYYLPQAVFHVRAA
jgi:hypothetical protein